MKGLEDIVSRLDMRNIGVESITFRRDPLLYFSGETEVKLAVQYQPPDESPSMDEYVVRMRLRLVGETGGQQVLYLEIILIASFVIHEPDPEVFEILFRRNTLALMMPYMRAEVTQITAQPGMAPIVLPAIDINKFVDNLVIENNSDSNSY